MVNTLWDGRGVPWEHDAGPPRNRSWGRLFAETPNYRGLGHAVTNRNAFRWHFGPMFYRGRLWDGQARVLVVGQEGAQDESLANRSFVGGTGARMQYVLQHLGITRSYVFLNTFVYPIFGQYDNEPLRLLAQDPDSPIRRHRHELLDYLVDRSELRLVLAVGVAAKESMATWVQAHGGSADPARLHEAEADRVAPGLRIVGLMHPGGTNTGAIVADFRRAMERIERWAQDDPGWLPTDPDGERLPADAYRYRSAPIPFQDLPYGANWRLGRGGTSSNRRDGQTAIQLYSADGTYNNQGHSLTYSGPDAGTDDGYQQDPGDRGYEPPRAAWRTYDRGPTAAFGRLLQGGHPSFPWPDFGALGLRSHASFGLGPGYRGRLADVALLVVAAACVGDDGPASAELTSRLSELLPSWGIPALVANSARDVVAIFPWTQSDADGLEIARQMITHVQRQLPATRLVAGVSGPADGARALRRPLREARQACRVLRRRSSGEAVERFSELGTYHLLLGGEDGSSLRRISDTVLLPLREYDARRGGQLEVTLRAFLGNDAQLASTASALYIHVNTLRNRLAKITELTGRDVMTTEGRVDTFLALEADAMVGAAD
jgi:uracil-DNA glycosylase